MDEKFKSIDEKDKEILEMRRSTRDKDHELELAKANVIACEGVIEVKIIVLYVAYMTVFV